tara:strand:+ start:159 stop:371 length:213 start_codon:yes stop_codon:yes gene_type:complete
MSFEKDKRASDVEISSHLTSDLNINTPQKVDISALKLKIIKKEKKETIKNRVINFTILIGLGTIAYFISN